MHASVKWLVLLLLTGVLLAEDKKEQAAQLFQTAIKLSDIRTPNSPPFRLDAHVTRKDKGTVLEGEYLEIWASPRQWRREVTLGDDHFVQVADATDEKHSWVVEPRTHFGFAKQILDLAELEDLREETAHPKKLSPVTKDGLQLTCIESKGDEYGGRKITCFDASTGSLRSVERSSHGPTWRRDYLQYGPVGTNIFPRLIKSEFSDGDSLELTVTKFLSEPQYDAATFSRPEDSEHRPVCARPEAPRVLREPDPEYPRGQSGAPVVVVQMIVETAGRPRDLNVLESQGQAFDAAAINAVRNWTFKLATCDGEALPVTVNIEILFRP
jgi:TonB family protein